MVLLFATFVGLLIGALIGCSLTACWFYRRQACNLAHERDFLQAELFGRVGLKVPVAERQVAKPVEQQSRQQYELHEQSPLEMYKQLQRGWGPTDWRLYDDYRRTQDSAIPRDEAALFEKWVEENGSQRPSEVYALGAGMV